MTTTIACTHPSEERSVHDFGDYHPNGYLNGPTGVHLLCSGCGWDFGEVGTVTDMGDPATPLPLEGTTTITYRVQCEDGMTRHEHDFVSLAGAMHWAHWGHACTNAHVVREVRTVETLRVVEDQVAAARRLRVGR